MKRLLFFCALFFLQVSTAQAHNPLAAIYYLDGRGDIGLLNIGITQAALDKSLADLYSVDTIKKLSSLEYQELAVKYIKDRIHLSVNGQDIKILRGGIKMGSHETDLKFITSQLPKKFELVDIEIDTFKKNGPQQNIFVVLLPGETRKAILSRENNYRSSLIFNGNKMSVKSDASGKYYLLIALFFLILLVVTLSLRRRQKLNGAKPCFHVS